ncbi:MAG: DUF2752 domain-containing protein [Acidobacteriota bacterium]
MTTLATPPGAAAPADPVAVRGGRQLAILWAAAALALLALAPFGGFFAGVLPPCPFKSLTGIPCPGCGTTRAALALAAFRPLEALILFPLPTVAWVFFLSGGAVSAVLALSGRGLPAVPLPPTWARWALVGVVIAHWAYSIATGV